jgi:hypothetical protein
MRFAPEVECGLDGVIKDRDNPGPKVTQNKKITERINEIPTEQQQIAEHFFFGWFPMFWVRAASRLVDLAIHNLWPNEKNKKCEEWDSGYGWPNAQRLSEQG